MNNKFFKYWHFSSKPFLIYYKSIYYYNILYMLYIIYIFIYIHFFLSSKKEETSVSLQRWQICATANRYLFLICLLLLVPFLHYCTMYSTSQYGFAVYSKTSQIHMFSCSVSLCPCNISAFSHTLIFFLVLWHGITSFIQQLEKDNLMTFISHGAQADLPFCLLSPQWGAVIKAQQL